MILRPTHCRPLHYNCHNSLPCLRQQHDQFETFSQITQQHHHFHMFPTMQQWDQNKTSIWLWKQDGYGDRSTPPCHHHDHLQQCKQTSHDAVGLWQQSDDDHGTQSQLWQEKEQVLHSFSCRFSKASSNSLGDNTAITDIKLGLLLCLCKRGQLDKALDVLFCMDPTPSTHVYLYLLNQCNKSKALAQQSKQVYAHFCQHNATFADFLAEYLVLTISKGSAIQDVQHTALSLPCLSVFAWSAMISALVEYGHVHEALNMVQQMYEDGAEPSSYTFVSLIKACGITQDLWHGKKLHAAACMKGFASHLIIGSTLVSMYGKCGVIMEAKNVFNALCTHDIVSCNAMLAAFLEVGQEANALRLYRQMHAEGMHTHQGTFVIALQACRSVAELEDARFFEGRAIRAVSLEIGQTLHAEIRRKGFSRDVFINNTLVIMYGKIGAITEAEVVFNALPNRDVISWNAMLSTYVESNQGQKALWLYRVMVREDVSEDALTYVLALQACDIFAEDEQAVIIEGRAIKESSLEIGHALHLDACTSGFTSDLFLATALMSMYGICGVIMEAEDVFLSLPKRDIVSWNAMLSAYVEQGLGGKALQLFRQMQEESVGANSQTLVFALQACANLAEVEEARSMKGRSIKPVALEIGLTLHGYGNQKGITNSFVCNTLVSMYGNCGTIVEAEHVFAALSQPKVVSWNVMLSAYVEQGQGGQALQLFCQMQEAGTTPNHLTFVFALQACGILAEREAAAIVEGQLKKVGALEIGGALHKDAIAKGFTSDAFVGNTLLSMYGKCGDVFERDSVFMTLPHRDIISWNAMLSRCIMEGEAVQALRLYKHLQGQCMIVDDATLICILQACSTTGSLELCEQLHFSIVSACYEQYNCVAATLIYAYGSCARVADMRAFYNELLLADSVSWNACIAGHLGGEDFTFTTHMHEEMMQTAVEPDEVTFTSVLRACSHFGLVVNGLEYFESMGRYYNILPNLKHYGAMVDLFGRAGDFKRVEILLKKMPWEPDLSIVQCLLGACRTHSNVELAEWAFNLAVRLQPEKVTAYVLMSNMYAEDIPIEYEG